MCRMKRPRRMNVASHNMAVAAYWCVFNIVAAQIMTWRANFSSFATEYCAKLEWTFSTTYQSHKTFPLIFKSPILSRPHSNVDTMMVTTRAFGFKCKIHPFWEWTTLVLLLHILHRVAHMSASAIIHQRTTATIHVHMNISSLSNNVSYIHMWQQRISMASHLLPPLK